MFKGDPRRAKRVNSFLLRPLTLEEHKGAIQCLLHPIKCDSGFDAGKLASVLWLAGLAMKLKDEPDIGTLTGNPVEAVIALVTTLLAWA